MASTSSATPLESKEWDVFIIFRGADIDREGFLNDLCTEFQDRKYINTFADPELPHGNQIPEDLLLQLDKSHVVVVIFSQHFADSWFCLDELVRICKCRNPSDRNVLPVFYHVDTDDVQKPQNFFGETFNDIVEQHKDETERVEDWKKALKKISNVKGFVSSNKKTEYQLIKEIVEVVWKKLCELPLPDAIDPDNPLIGIDSNVNQVKLLLDVESLEINYQTVGIWGLPGVGKTTLADRVYNQIKARFKGNCHFVNVKEELERHSLSNVRDEIIRDLLGLEKIVSIGTPNEIKPAIKRIMKGRKVLIVFDDVEDGDNLKHLAGDCNLYGQESRIIITSRDKQVFNKFCSDEYIHEVKVLSDEDALKLFCFHAFNPSHPIDQQYLELSRKVIRYAQGLPLALRVLGSALYGLEIKVWESELEKWKQFSNGQIVQDMKISYDRLETTEQDIFLDIACFFKGKYIHQVERILEGCGFYPKGGIVHLINKSLISISSNKRVEMHDLIRQMGHEIVYKECKQPRECSRLWRYEDIYDVLTRDMDAGKVEAIRLQSFRSEEIESYVQLFTISDQERKQSKMEPSKEVFAKMSNLRLLEINNTWSLQKVQPPEGLEILPDTLRYLSWDNYSLQSLPLDPKNLVELHLRGSKLQDLWQENQSLDKLKYMDLSNSHHLTHVPDLARFPNLEVLYLFYCSRLVEISLSRTMTSSKLKILKCNNCYGLSKIPEDLSSLSSLEELHLAANNLKNLPASIKLLSKLRLLHLRFCEKLECLPELPKSLKDLDVGGCISLNSASTSFLSSEGEGGCIQVNFVKCIKLDKNVCKETVEKVLAMHLVKQAVYLCIVGDEIPPSMPHKEGGSSMSFALDERQVLVGLSLCAVLKDGFFYGIVCEANFEDESGQSIQFKLAWNMNSPLLATAQGWYHRFYWYEPFHEEKHFTQASFKFFVCDSSQDGVDDWPFAACDVHPIYL